MKRGQESTIADNSSTNLTRIALRERELLRERYRPDQVRILFIGEAPPVSGRFFYQADSGLYRAFRDTFVAAFSSLQPLEFLTEFRALGCYLVDLCGRPVDHLNRDRRVSICRSGEVRLTRTVRSLHPVVVVTVVKSICASVERALRAADWSGLHLELPYPGRWKRHRDEFKRQLMPVLLLQLSQPHHGTEGEMRN
jgi:hypothetical protein